MFIELILILILAVFTRIIFLFNLSSDDWVETKFVKDHKNRGWVSAEIEDSVVGGFQARPVLNNWLISRFPQKYWRKIGITLNIGYDLILISASFILAYFILPEMDNLIVSPAIWVAVLVAFSPLMHPVTSRLRGFFKNRSLGNLLSLGLIINTGGWVIYQNPVALLGILIFLWLTFYSSQFGTQTNILFLITYSVLTFNWFLLLITGLFIGVIILISPWVRKLIRWKFPHYKWYWENQWKISLTRDRNSVKEFFKLPYYLIIDLRKFLKTVTMHQSILILMYSVPAFTLGLISGLNNFSEFQGFISLLWLENGWPTFSLQVIVALLIIFLLTSMRLFLFLGQAERYLVPALPFISILFFRGIMDNIFSERLLFWGVILSFIGILLNFITVNYGNLKENIVGRPRKELDELIENLEIMEGNVLTIPIKLSYALSSRTGKKGLKFVFRGVYHPLKGKSWIYDDLFAKNKFNYPKKDIRKFVSNYQIDYIVAVKSIILNGRYQFGEAQKIFDNKRYVIYRILKKPVGEASE